MGLLFFDWIFQNKSILRYEKEMTDVSDNKVSGSINSKEQQIQAKQNHEKNSTNPITAKYDKQLNGPNRPSV